MLVYKIYTLIGRSAWLKTYEWAVVFVGFMILFGLVQRIGTDELAPTTKKVVYEKFFKYASDWKDRGNSIDRGVFCLGILCFILSSVCLVLVLVDFHLSVQGMPNSAALQSFYWCWVGYPIVALLTMIARQQRPTQEMSENEFGNGYNEYLSLFKDVVYGMLDVYSKAFFAAWTAWA